MEKDESNVVVQWCRKFGFMLLTTRYEIIKSYTIGEIFFIKKFPFAVLYQ